jgi:hypothetical protein
VKQVVETPSPWSPGCGNVLRSGNHHTSFSRSGERRAERRHCERRGAARGWPSTDQAAHVRVHPGANGRKARLPGHPLHLGRRDPRPRGRDTQHTGATCHIDDAHARLQPRGRNHARGPRVEEGGKEELVVHLGGTRDHLACVVHVIPRLPDRHGVNALSPARRASSIEHLCIARHIASAGTTHCIEPFLTIGCHNAFVQEPWLAGRSGRSRGLVAASGQCNLFEDAHLRHYVSSTGEVIW